MKKVLVLGDSHTLIFNFCNKKQQSISFDVCEVGGATAQGIVNPNSKTDALEIFQQKLENITESYDKVIVMLGEVDCGFVIWVRYKRYGISVDEQIQLSIDNLFNFCSKVLSKKFNSKNIIILGSILPTIKDYTQKEILFGARSEVDIPQDIRTEKTLEYNSLLKIKCKESGYGYADITKYIISDNGIIKDDFLNKDADRNHHLDDESTYQLWLNEIQKLL